MRDLLFIAGDRSNGVIVAAGDQRYRITLNTSGAVNVNGSGDITVAVGGNPIVTAGGIELAGSGGKKVALDNDPVVSGQVQASSGKVTAK